MPVVPEAVESSGGWSDVQPLLLALNGSAVACVCLGVYCIWAARRRALMQMHARVLTVAPAPFELEPPSAPAAATAASLAELRTSGVQGGMHVLAARLYKPQAMVQLGINLRGDPEGSHSDAIVASLAPDSIAFLSGVLAVGDRISAVNGVRSTGVSVAAGMLRQAEGTILLEILRPSGVQSTRLPSNVGCPPHADGPDDSDGCEAMSNETRVEPLSPDERPISEVELVCTDHSSSSPLLVPRPWSARTHRQVSDELTSAAKDADAARLAALAQRVNAELTRLRCALGAGGLASSATLAAAASGARDRVRFTAEIPAEFRCPISQEIMEDPVTTADGHTYERREIFRWLCGHSTSPLTGSTLPNRTLTPAHALRALISAFFNAHPELAHELKSPQAQRKDAPPRREPV